METHKIFYESTELEYNLITKNVKNINLRIKPNGKIIVSANRKVSVKCIEDFIASKWKWINKKLAIIENARKDKPKVQYIDGDIIKYLGKEITLKVIESQAQRTYFSDNKLFVLVKDKEDTNRKKELLSQWYKNESIKIFNSSIDKMFFLLDNYNLKRPHLKVRLMKSRWGSCLKYKNTITLNLLLIQMPESVIDYVVLHELIHFIISSHDKEFYNMLTKLMPSWKSKDQLLKHEWIREF